MKHFYVSVIILLFAIGNLQGQTPCTTLGQNPQTAFPVCGSSVFQQTSVPLCGDRPVTHRCGSVELTDLNPFWYKFTCFASGTLGFLISPLTPSDDYDWQLFDVTGRNPQEVYTNPATFVASNWSGESGNTGASSAGNSLILCDGPGVPRFSAMPNLIQGHEYLLLISHFTISQSGYNLSFGGGTAVITDPADPHLDSASAACDGTIIDVVLNKKMRCSSLAINGSDFSVNYPAASIISATGEGCASSFEMEKVRLTLSAPLPPGNYNITIKNGSDGNTLKDLCDREISVNESIPLTVFPVSVTQMDSLTTPRCAPEQLELVFQKKIRCNSIAADGTDFIVNGTYAAAVSSASGNCTDGLTDRIIVSLASPMVQGGNFNIRLVRSALDGNTLIDECGQEVPVNSQLPFSLKDTVSANFNFTINSGCELDSVRYLHNGAHGVNEWTWVFDNDRFSNVPDPEIYYSTSGEKVTSLFVSNGFCSSTQTKVITIAPKIDAAFEGSAFACPGEPATFFDASTGDVTGWLWNFGNGNTSINQTPPQQFYPLPGETMQLPVSLTVSDTRGCTDTETQFITVVENCFIAVPAAFTPNGDGLNDFFYPLNAYKAANLSFSVYNRNGQRVFFTRNWLNKWDGKFRGQAADAGTYVWVLDYINDSNKPVHQKGTVILIR